MKSHYTPASSENWTGRSSADRAYIHENIHLCDLQSGPPPEQGRPAPVLLGYATDEGVRRNQGRAGAAEGPGAIRKALGKMPLLRGGAAPLWDAGDLSCPDGDLESLQVEFAGMLAGLLKSGYLPLALGGGHDIAYAHFLGLQEGLGGDSRLGILNFDAHFDLRVPLPRGHSGSPFLQMAEYSRKAGKTFRYGCLGVRKDANPQELWDQAASLEVMVVGREEMAPAGIGGVLQRLGEFLQPLDALYLTIDLDGFSAAYAPGVSAPSPLGFSPEALLPCLDHILESGKLKSMDIAELNPALDRDGQTAVLAASLVHRVLHHPGLF